MALILPRFFFNFFSNIFRGRRANYDNNRIGYSPVIRDIVSIKSYSPIFLYFLNTIDKIGFACTWFS